MSSSLHVWRADLSPRPSRFLLCLAAVLHIAAAGAMLASALPWPAQALLMLLILFSAFHAWKVELSVRGLRLLEQGGGWYLIENDKAIPVTLSRVRVWRYLVLLDIEMADRRQRLVLVPDALPPEVFRRLRVRLKYARLQPAP
ncbi:MAG TPA: protein YgfX [Moraxellaceae bacterium]